MTLTTISYGGGVQSTAMIVLAVEGRLGYDVDAAVFANVGDDSEHPATLVYVRDVMTPWAAERGLPVVEVQRVNRAGEPQTIVGTITRPGSTSNLIPVYLSGGAPGARGCTRDYKIVPIGRWLREHGATRDDPADVLIGISVDEIERAGRGADKAYERRRYPLLDLGLNRSDCSALIARAGLPVPPKSACYFCPYHGKRTWQEMRRDEPDLFDKAQDLEDALAVLEAARGRAPVFLTRHGRRLTDAISAAQDTLPGLEPNPIGETGCDEGYCWT